jgi:signal transduction histidine kinase
MRKVLILLAFFLSQSVLFAQKHPLSKSDSGIIFKNLEKYEYLMKSNDVRGASGALNDVAFTFWNNNHYQEAAHYYERSLKLNEQVANENGIAMINNNLGMLYSDIGEYDKALTCFSKTLSARRSHDEPAGITSALINISVVLNNLHRYDESIELLSEALDIARGVYDKYQMRSVYGMLSETYEKKGDVEKSLKYFDLYKTFHEELQRQEVTSLNKQLAKEKVQTQIVEAENAMNEIEILRKELEILKQAQLIQMKDSLNQELYTNLSKQQIAMELLEKEKELGELESLAKEQQNKQLVKERATLRIVFGVGLLATLIIGSLIFLNMRKTRRYAMLMKEKNLSIEKQRMELETANDLKNRMFSIISHDLRSPISSLQGFFSVIDGFEMDEELKQALNSVESQLTNSATLLENLLSWSKSQIQNADPIIEQVRISELVNETFMLLQFQADKKNIQLITNVTSEDVLETDKSMINIVIRNLVQNAIKFTPEGGSVIVNFENEYGHKCIKVQDTGVGMTEKKIADLFDISTNRSSVGTAKEKGSGLGLILCKELIAKVNGLIEVTSKPGMGSVFVLKF